MVLNGKIVQMDKDRKTAKIRYENFERILVDYSGRGEEDPDKTYKVFEPILLESMLNNKIIEVHIDEEWRVYMIKCTEMGKV